MKVPIERLRELTKPGVRWLMLDDDHGPRFIRRTLLVQLMRLTNGKKGRPLGSWRFVNRLDKYDAQPRFLGLSALICEWDCGRVVLVFTTEPWKGAPFWHPHRRKSDTARQIAIRRVKKPRDLAIK